MITIQHCDAARALAGRSCQPADRVRQAQPLPTSVLLRAHHRHPTIGTPPSAPLRARPSLGIPNRLWTPQTHCIQRLNSSFLGSCTCLRAETQTAHSISGNPNVTPQPRHSPGSVEAPDERAESSAENCCVADGEGKPLVVPNCVVEGSDPPRTYDLNSWCFPRTTNQHISQRVLCELVFLTLRSGDAGRRPMLPARCRRRSGLSQPSVALPNTTPTNAPLKFQGTTGGGSPTSGPPPGCNSEVP